MEDDVDVWRYAIVSCMPETTTIVGESTCINDTFISIKTEFHFRCHTGHVSVGMPGVDASCGQIALP